MRVNKIEFLKYNSMYLFPDDRLIAYSANCIDYIYDKIKNVPQLVTVDLIFESVLHVFDGTVKMYCDKTNKDISTMLNYKQKDIIRLGTFAEVIDKLIPIFYKSEFLDCACDPYIYYNSFK